MITTYGLTLAEEGPFHVDRGGKVCLSPTRVSLDTVVLGLQRGLDLDDLAEMYAWVPREVLEAAVALYHERREAVQAYLDARAAAEEAAPRRTDLPEETRQRLIALAQAKRDQTAAAKHG